MDKGKSPILEEEDVMSFLDQLPDTSSPLSPPVSGGTGAGSSNFGNSLQFNSVVDISPPHDLGQNNVTGIENIVSNNSTLYTDLSGSGSLKEIPILNENEGSEEEFLGLNFNDVLAFDPSSSVLKSKPVPLMPETPADPALARLPPKPPVPRAKAIFRKAIPPEQLAELSRNDPKRARRIITNRMAATRAKEKKKLELYMLEHKVQTLQAESSLFTVNLALMEANSKSLTSENTRLRHQVDDIVQRINLQDALNEQTRMEIQSLKLIAGYITPNEATMINPNASSGNSNIHPMNSAGIALPPPQFRQQLHVQTPRQQLQTHCPYNLQQHFGQHNNQLQQYMQRQPRLLQQRPPLHPQQLHYRMQNAQVQSHFSQQAAAAAGAPTPYAEQPPLGDYNDVESLSSECGNGGP